MHLVLIAVDLPPEVELATEGQPRPLMSGLNREQDDGRPKPSASTSSAATSSAAMSGAVMSALERSGGMELPTNVPFGGMAAGHLSPELVEQVSKESAALLGVAAHHHAAALAGRRDSVMMGIPDDENEDSDDDVPSGSKRAGRRKICIKYIEDKSRRHITFSKRKAGIMKKAYELSTLTGTQVLLLVASETGHVYTFATPKLQPLITKPEGKNLIQACLNAPDVTSEYGNQGGNNYESGDDNGKDSVYDERGSSSGQASGIPVNYAAAMAGLAGFQYPGGQGNAAAASAAFLNAAHYPAYAAQYNAALAAGYWPGTTTNNQTNVATAVNVVPQPTGTSVDVSNSVDVTAVGSSVTKTQSQQP